MRNLREPSFEALVITGDWPPDRGGVMVFIISLILPPAVHSTLEMAACCWGFITVVSVSGQQTEYKLCIADTAAQTQKCCSSYYWKEFIFFITFNRPGRIVLCIVVTMIHNDNIVSRSCTNTCSHDSLVLSRANTVLLYYCTALRTSG